MRRHAKASTAGSTEHQAGSLGHSLRGAFANLGVLSEGRGSSAPKISRTVFGRTFTAALAAALIILGLSVASAGAAPSRPFQENFGSAVEQTFEFPRALAFDQGAGELLVTSGGTQGILKRFDEDGTPVDFSALGTDVIDGKLGPGGKPCAQEPASCDAVPQGEMYFQNAFNVNVDIDESGGLTDGNIYVTQPEFSVVSMFAADGRYLGQLTGFIELGGVGVDPNGNVYVSDAITGIAKFVPSTNAPVNGDRTDTFTSLTEPYALAPGAGPTAGSLFVTAFGTGDPTNYKIDGASGAVDYDFFQEFVTTQTVDPVTGHVFVGRASKVSEFDASGASSAQKLSEVNSPGEVKGVAVNSDKDFIYVSTDSGKVAVYGPAPPVPSVATGAVSNLSSTGATLNATVNPQGFEVESCVFEWGETAAPYEHTTPCAESAAQIGEGSTSVPVHADISGLSEAKTYHYRIVATNSNGPSEGEDETFSTPAPPLIEEEAVQSASRTEAQLVFKVNPRNFPTTYHIEYGLADQPYEHSTPERGVGSDGVFHALTFHLSGLFPGTPYHWRVVATNADPAFPGTGMTTGDEHRFHTGGTAVPNTNCPNQAFRTGTSAALPDCRAYEMVSPIEKNGGDIAAFLSFTQENGSSRAAYDQASLDGNRITYTSGTPFGDVISGRNANQYIASRSTNGWTTHAINAPAGPILEERLNLFYGLETAFTLFTPDLSEAWVQDGSVTPLTADGALEVPNLYRRDNGSGSYDALTNQEPPEIPSGPFAREYGFRLLGHSSDFNQVLFDTRAPMTADAFATTKFTYQTYQSVDGDLHLVSVLPDGSASPGDSISNALSADGSRAFWVGAIGTDVSRVGRGQGQVYLRLNPAEAQSAQALGSARGTGILNGGSNVITDVDTSSGAFAVGQKISVPHRAVFLPEGVTITAVGPDSLTLSANAKGFTNAITLVAWSECTEPDKACTIPVSATAPNGNDAEFQFANADGSKAWFKVFGGIVAGDDLYEFDLATRTSTHIAGHSKGAAGISEDGSRLYFVSEEDLASGATDGEPNLYLREGGTETFIATLVPADLANEPTGIVSYKQSRGTRISPDGSHLVFQSASKDLAEEVADYDNTDAISGKADREVYRYEAGGELHCVSCNPSGARPMGGRLEKSFFLSGETKELTNTWGAAWIPGWEHFFNAQRVLSDDGSRVFFNSLDALIPGDTNGTQDVYQWERPGSGDCSEASTAFSEQNGGCISLISSGQSSQISEFIDATPSGGDVFFSTGSSLDPRDPGLVDIYDARVNGGFTLPPAPPNPCVGDSCQSPPPAPNDPTPTSAGFHGAGNPTPRKARQRNCRARKSNAKQSAKSKRAKAKRCKRAKRGAKR